MRGEIESLALNFSLSEKEVLDKSKSKDSK